MRGDGGNDMLTGSNDARFGRDLLFGRAGNDRLRGRAGDDNIDGGWGVDVMGGGTGRDLFDLNEGDSGVGKGHRDIVTDFARGEDRLDLASIDADARRPGDQGFTFIGTKPFAADATGQLRFLFDGRNTVVQGSTDADRAPEFELELAGRVALAAADFHL
jgi:Ca2+-binding RTX toxin-like protein